MLMKKYEIYTFIQEILMKIENGNNPLAPIEAYVEVDDVIKQHDFYEQTPYFLSEWLILKEQVLRNDSESLGYLKRFLDNIMHEGAIGLYEAYLAQYPGK